jgi:ArsR family transcriptional regulator, lead/cadmium/zinc/bismuth-responsive transcriptional repressor
MYQEQGTASSLNTLNTLNSMKKRGIFYLLAETFQVLGDSSRVQIVWALMQGEKNVGTLTKLLKMSQPAVSHHLRTLRNLRLVKLKKIGRTSVYSLDDHHINALLIEGINHVEDLL